ncbi:hypothetical protein KIF59_23090 [Enterobacter cloacae subsp. cloacae]|nr:hypothetical protein [Enterobacter cloacae subsp. cloacae]
MGNESSSSSWTVTIDTDAPVKPTIDAALDDVGSVQGNLAGGGTTDDPTPTLSGKGGSPGGTTTVRSTIRTACWAVTAKADGFGLLTGGETAGRRHRFPRDGHRQGGPTPVWHRTTSS